MTTCPMLGIKSLRASLHQGLGPSARQVSTQCNPGTIKIFRLLLAR